MVTEEWRPVPGHAGEIFASSLGRIKRVEFTITTPRFRRTFKAGVLRLRRETSTGYLVFSHRGQTISVHRSVCSAFHGPSPVGARLARHLDDDKDNNKAINLAWGSHADNYSDSICNGRTPLPKRARITEKDVLAIRRSDLCSDELGKIYGLSSQHVRRIRAGEKWQSVSMDVAA